jgi:hypothetical protein
LSSPASPERVVAIDPILELLVAYAIVHLDMRGERARKWATRQRWLMGERFGW